MKRIVLVAGFESFNADLYRKAAFLATSRVDELDIRVFSDRDITAKRTEVEAALKGADVFLAVCCSIMTRYCGCAIASLVSPSAWYLNQH